MTPRQRLLKIALHLAVLIATGCDGLPPGDPPGGPVPDTEILRVDVEPDPVAAGDTALFTVTIADSLDESFVFSWALSDGTPTWAKTDTNSVWWIAPALPGRYTHSVMAYGGDPNGSSPIAKFSVTVTK